jgi:hypothetical protein
VGRNIFKSVGTEHGMGEKFVKNFRHVLTHRTDMTATADVTTQTGLCLPRHINDNF